MVCKIILRIQGKAVSICSSSCTSYGMSLCLDSVCTNVAALSIPRRLPKLVTIPTYGEMSRLFFLALNLALLLD